MPTSEGCRRLRDRTGGQGLVAGQPPKRLLKGIARREGLFSMEEDGGLQVGGLALGPNDRCIEPVEARSGHETQGVADLRHLALKLRSMKVDPSRWPIR